MKVEIDAPELPDGFEYTGKLRRAKEGEYWASESGDVVECYIAETSNPHLIVRKSKTEVELLQDKLNKLYEAAIAGIRYVGAANYAEREQEAISKVEQIYFKESE